jgi:hypothetical protein
VTHAQSVIRGGYIAFSAISIILLIAGVANLVTENGNVNDSKWYIIIAICVAFASAILRRLMPVSNKSKQQPSKLSSIWLISAAICFAAIGVGLVLSMTGS